MLITVGFFIPEIAGGVLRQFDVVLHIKKNTKYINEKIILDFDCSIIHGLHKYA